MGVGGQRHAPAALPPGKSRYPLYRRMGESQGRSVRVRKISPPPGFDPRTVQSVASRYTDWAIPAPADWGPRRRICCRAASVFPRGSKITATTKWMMITRLKQLLTRCLVTKDTHIINNEQKSSSHNMINVSVVEGSLWKLLRVATQLNPNRSY